MLLHEASQRVANQSIIHTCLSISLLCLYIVFSFLPPLQILNILTEKVVEETRVKVLTSIEAVKLTLKATSATYDVSPSTAEIIWKVITPSCLLCTTTLPLTCTTGPVKCPLSQGVLCESRRHTSFDPLP